MTDREITQLLHRIRIGDLPNILDKKISDFPINNNGIYSLTRLIQKKWSISHKTAISSWLHVLFRSSYVDNAFTELFDSTSAAKIRAFLDDSHNWPPSIRPAIETYKSPNYPNLHEWWPGRENVLVDFRFRPYPTRLLITPGTLRYRQYQIEYFSPDDREHPKNAKQLERIQIDIKNLFLEVLNTKVTPDNYFDMLKIYGRDDI